MKPISKCPDETILKAVVLGEINEPLLYYYLDHIDSCEHCSETIDKSSWPLLEFQELIKRSHVNKEDLKPAHETVDAAWLESVKMSYPGRDFIPANNPDNALGLPEVIGDYRLTNLIGDGATSIVYSAADMTLHREVALKILHPEFDNQPELQESILSEARAIASLNHENILPIFHIEKLGSNPVLVFPLLPGSTLQKALENRDFSLRESLEIIRDICRALQYIHDRGIIHRDIKPSNIWLEKKSDGGNKALLFDFGFAGMEQNRSGTSGYMAPEQIRHQKNTTATDMFALGSLLFQITGQGAAPENVKKIIHQLLSEESAERLSASQLLATLDAMLKPRKKPILLLAGGLCLVAMVLIFSTNPLGSNIKPPSKEEPLTQKSIPPKKLRPAVAVFEGKSGFPSALSGDGKIFVRHRNNNTLEYLRSPTDNNPLEISSGFMIFSFELNSNGSLLAIAGSMGELQVLKMPGKELLHSSTLDSRSEKLAWAGADSNILVTSLAGKPHYLQPEKGGDSYPKKPVELKTIVSSIKTNPLLKEFSAQSMGPLLALQFGNESVNVWSSKENQVIQISPTLDKELDCFLGWRSPEIYCMYQGRKVVEINTNPENTQKSKMVRDMDIWELPSSPLDVCWIDKNSLVFLTDIGGKKPKLLYGKRGSRDFVEEFDTRSKYIQKLKLLDIPGTFAVYSVYPSTNIFIFDIKAPPAP